MSLRDVSMFYVLGEDPAHRSFVRSWLNANKIHPRRVFSIEPTAGKSGGVSFVLARCKATVEDAGRRDRVKAKTRVIIAIDADDATIEARQSDITRAIEQGGSGDDLHLVCVLIPRRHMETWVHSLGSADASVNEQDNYKPKATDAIIAAARRLAGLQSGPTAPPSLVHGYEQLQRLKAM